MTDPRNIAHDKKILEQKKHEGKEAAPGAEHAVQPGKKPHIEHPADKAKPGDQDEKAGS